MQALNTTDRPDAFLDRYQALIERLITRYRLPLHVVFLEEMAENARGFQDVLRSMYPESAVAFAVKSNPCRGAVRAAQRLGLGADAASEYELQAALEEGIEPSTIICNGNAKSAEYIDMALRAGALIGLDNEAEILRLEERAHRAEAQAHVLVRLRGMPLSGLTSVDQTTAADWTKFGFHVDEAERLFSRIRSSDRLRFCGLSAHIGTQVADPVGYELLLDQLLRLADLAGESAVEEFQLALVYAPAIAVVLPELLLHDESELDDLRPEREQFRYLDDSLLGLAPHLGGLDGVGAGQEPRLVHLQLVDLIVKRGHLAGDVVIDFLALSAIVRQFILRHQLIPSACSRFASPSSERSPRSTLRA